jgi:DNA repair exonuclease SbcCD ATPase subunit
MNDTDNDPVLDGDDINALKAALRERDHEIAALQSRVAELEQRPRNDTVEELINKVLKLSSERKRYERQYPSLAHRVKMAELMKKVPPGIITKQGANKWCDPNNSQGKVDAKKIGSDWYVVPESFWKHVEITARRKGISFVRPT